MVIYSLNFWALKKAVEGIFFNFVFGGFKAVLTKIVFYIRVVVVH